MLTEAFYILLFYFTGEFISYFIDGFIPGSVIGMVLLFLALAFKKVKPEKVKRLSMVLIQSMGLFSIPAGVGFMSPFGIIPGYRAVLLIASVVSTILVIASVALVQQKPEKGKQTTDNLVHSEISALTLVTGTYLTSLTLYKKVHISFLHPLLTTTFVIIVVLEALGIQYELFQQSSHLIYFMLGPSVAVLGYALYEQIQYLKGNAVSISTFVSVRAVAGIVSAIIIGKLMRIDQALIAMLQSRSVTTPIATGIAEKAGGIPSLTAVIIVAVGIFGSIAGPIVIRILGIDSHIAKGLALGAFSHGVGTAAAIQTGAIEGTLSGLAIGLMGIMTVVLIPITRLTYSYLSI